MSEAALSEAQPEQEPPKKRYSGSFLALCRGDLGNDRRSVRGSPGKLTEATILEIAQAVGNGVPYLTACVAAGITSQTANRWIQKGNEELENGKNTLHVKFVELLKFAAANGQRNLANAVADNPDWRAKAFILERRHPETWGKKEQAQNVTNVVISDNLAGQLLDAIKVATNGSVVIDVTPTTTTASLAELEAPASTLGESEPDPSIKPR